MKERRTWSLLTSCVQVFNLNSPQTVYKELDSPLKFQTRCITCFPDATGYLVSSSAPVLLRQTLGFLPCWELSAHVVPEQY